jgi:hypothetical protein
MQFATRRVRIDPQEVIHETVDGEVILIALQTGCYYSLEGSAAEIWAGLVAGRTSAEIAAELEGRYSAGPAVIPEAVGDLVKRLMDEGLARPAEPDGTPARIGEPHPESDVERVPFAPPVMHKFTDMQYFLFVDPVHEVGDAGWPHPPSA